MTLGRIESTKRKRSDTEAFTEEKKTQSFESKVKDNKGENQKEYEKIRKDSSINHYEADYDIKCEPSLKQEPSVFASELRKDDLVNPIQTDYDIKCEPSLKLEPSVFTSEPRK